MIHPLDNGESCVLDGGGIRLTPGLAYAAGRDAGNRSMRKKWPATAWDDEDHAIACETTNRLLGYLYPEVAQAEVLRAARRGRL